MFYNFIYSLNITGHSSYKNIKMIKHKTSKSKNPKDSIKDTTQPTSTSFKLTQNKSSLQNASSCNNLLNIQHKTIPSPENFAVVISI